MRRIDNTKEPSGEGHVGQTFVGKYRPKPSEREDHAGNFGRALQAALEIADNTRVTNERKRMKLKNTFEVKVVFEATVRVRSPGNIGEYRAVITEQ